MVWVNLECQLTTHGRLLVFFHNAYLGDMICLSLYGNGLGSPSSQQSKGPKSHVHFLLCLLIKLEWAPNEFTMLWQFLRTPKMVWIKNALLYHILTIYELFLETIWVNWIPTGKNENQHVTFDNQIFEKIILTFHKVVRNPYLTTVNLQRFQPLKILFLSIFGFYLLHRFGNSNFFADLHTKSNFY